MWAWIHVYNHGTLIKSFYEHRDYLLTKVAIKEVVDRECGLGCWTNYTLEY